jgi:adenine-specific DNA-methyltransferase
VTKPKDDIAKFDLRSEDIAEARRQELLRIFPEVHTESGGINFEALRLSLGDAIQTGPEGFGMSWPGRAECAKTILRQSAATLLPDEGESVNWDITQNVIIEGDNLEVLKVLQKAYLGKVKIIYIDPPYNTGSDFIYPDNYTESLKTYLQYTGQVDDEGRKFSTNTESSGRFHSKWMNMMYPRLKIAADLLTEDGIMCVSIDDKEYPRLVSLMAEVFGEENLKTICIKMSEPTGVKMAHVAVAGIVPKLKEYLIIGKKDGIKGIYLDKLPKEKWDEEYKTLIVNATPEQIQQVKFIRDNEDRSYDDIELLESILSLWKVESCSDALKRLGLDKKDHEQWKYENAWRIIQIATLTGGARDRAKEKKAAYRSAPSFFSIVTPQKKCYLISGAFNTDAELPRCKVLFADDYLTVHPGDFWSDIKTTGLDNEGGVPFKNGKKPLKLLERVIKMSREKDCIVLDFFAGSGTTGEAVMAQNAKDGGTRKFVLVQLPEVGGMDSEMVAEGFNSIADVTRQRIRKSGKSISSAFSGPDTVRPDTGFRSFRLNESNFAVWDANAINGDKSKLEQQLFTQVEHVLPGRTNQDILFELMLKSRYGLTTPVEQVEVDNCEVWKVADGEMVAVIDAGLTVGVVRAIASWKPTSVVILDRCFGSDDSLKANARKIFEDSKVDLKTV